MIDKQTILKLAKLNNLRPWQQEKHYLQAAILTTLAEHPLVFKGGTYLWFFHGLARFSEDLDFTSQGKLPHDLAEEVSESLTYFGINNTLKPLKSDRYILSFKLACEGPLHTTEKDVSHIYVEISTREEILLKTTAHTLDVPAYTLPVKIIKGVDLEEVAAEKVRAIITRDKARDLFDLNYLLTAKKINPDLDLINQKLSFYNQEFSHQLLAEKINEKKTYWKGELQQLISQPLPPFREIQKNVLDWAKSIKP